MNFFEARKSTSAAAPDPSSSVTISPAVRGGRGSNDSTFVHAASRPTEPASMRESRLRELLRASG